MYGYTAAGRRKRPSCMILVAWVAEAGSGHGQFGPQIQRMYSVEPPTPIMIFVTWVAESGLGRISKTLRFFFGGKVLLGVIGDVCSVVGRGPHPQ